MTTAPARPTQFGRIHRPDEAWLAKNPPEPILEPDLPIIDTHHHLWDRGGHRYFLPDFLADAATGHNVIATVFLECHSMYRAGGPAEMRPVGEIEFVTGQAAMSASGMYGSTRVAAGIVGFADLPLGDRVEPVLEAQLRAGGGRFRGVRHSAAWDASDVIGNSEAAGRAPSLPARRVPRRPRVPDRPRALALRVGVPPRQLGEVAELAGAHTGGPTSSSATSAAVLGYGPYAGNRTSLRILEGGRPSSPVPERGLKLGGMIRRLAAYDYGKHAEPPLPASWPRSGARTWRPESSCSGRPVPLREQLSGGEGRRRLGPALERVQAHRRGTRPADNPPRGAAEHRLLLRGGGAGRDAA